MTEVWVSAYILPKVKSMILEEVEKESTKIKAAYDTKIEDERQARREAEAGFRARLDTERNARLDAERKVDELTAKVDVERQARLETEGRLATEVVERLRPGVETFLVEELGVEQEARYDALLEGTNNVRVKQETRCDALQDKFAFLGSEINILQDLALKNSSTLDAILERGDLTDKEIASLREWMGSMREGHVSLHDAFHAYQHHSNDMIAFFLERLTDANQEDPREPESSLVDSESPLEDSQGSAAHDPRGSDSSSDDSDSSSDDSEGSESEEEEEADDDDGGGPASNHENEEAADDYSDDDDDPREPGSGK
jgi:hypothetical protein